MADTKGQFHLLKEASSMFQLVWKLFLQLATFHLNAQGIQQISKYMLSMTTVWQIKKNSLNLGPSVLPPINSKQNVTLSC